MNEENQVVIFSCSFETNPYRTLKRCFQELSNQDNRNSHYPKNKGDAVDDYD